MIVCGGGALSACCSQCPQQSPFIYWAPSVVTMTCFLYFYRLHGFQKIYPSPAGVFPVLQLPMNVTVAWVTSNSPSFHCWSVVSWNNLINVVSEALFCCCYDAGGLEGVLLQVGASNSNYSDGPFLKHCGNDMQVVSCIVILWWNELLGRFIFLFCYFAMQLQRFCFLASWKHAILLLISLLGKALAKNLWKSRVYQYQIKNFW